MTLRSWYIINTAHTRYNTDIMPHYKHYLISILYIEMMVCYKCIYTM